MTSLPTNAVEFLKFHKENPAIWALYKKFAYEAKQAGHTKLSSEIILNRVRWETTITTNDKQFKINNNHKPFYARMLMYREHFTNFFAMRQSVADTIPKEMYLEL